MRADAYAQEIVNPGQLGALMSEILRGKALALVLEQAVITDESGARSTSRADPAPTTRRSPA